MTNYSTRAIRSAAVAVLSVMAWKYYELTAGANPIVGATAPQGANISSSGSQLTVNQTSPYAFINWQSFNIGAGETTTFVQPSSSSVAWNQINDVNPSQILGNLNANGYIILQNQNGFAVGGQAAISAHGLVMTTASTPGLNLSSGTWEFDTPPATAKIINYGQINIAGGGSAFLIASDIENGDGHGHGEISAPGGKIGLYAGEHVLVSMSPDGRGVSAKVTLPEGSVDNEGSLIADGGTIAAQAQTVNQGGLVEANAAQNVNGVIELVASDSVNLAASSVTSADGSGQANNAGGVSVQAGNAVNNNGLVRADGSSISLQGQTVNQNGTLQADSIDNANGAIGITATSDVNLGAGSVTSTEGGSQVNDVGGVTVQAGDTINNSGQVVADANSIRLQAQTVNQNGTLRANSIGSLNGAVEIDAGSSLKLGATSVISANGDATATTASPGGFVVLDAGQNTYADTVGSTISVSGQSGGQSGMIEILGNGIATGNIHSSLGNPFALLINPYDLTLSYNATAASSASPNNWNVSLDDLAPYSQIDLHALDNIELSGLPGLSGLSAWSLVDAGAAASLNLTAGNSIVLDDGSAINGGNNWNINLTARGGGMYLQGDADVQAWNGDINVWAANDVLINSDTTASGNGGIRTLGGGNIDVTAVAGDVNTGGNPQGYLYNKKTAPYYTVSTVLGGISTAAGGNVTIDAGGDVTSYLPTANSTTAGDDGGTGAFGPEPGNVTIMAAGNVYGHYVLANGVGTITAGNAVGAPNGQDAFALSLVDGIWNVNAPNGNIYLQEVRNPNGDFNTLGSVSAPAGNHLFNYGPQATVNLTAGDGVYLTDLNVPRLTSSPVQVIYPPILDIIAGAGGVTLQDNVTLFPSADQNLNITTTDGGSFVSAPNNPGETPELLMSDSSNTRWNASSTITPFSDVDNGTGVPLQAGNPNPAVISISGDMENINLITSKEADISVGGNMIDCGFSGQNLHSSDVTSIAVVGQIYNPSSISTINGVAIPSLPATDLLAGMANSWNDIFELAVDPAAVAGLIPTAGTTALQILVDASVFGVSSQGSVLNPPGFIYDQATGQLGYSGKMGQSVLSALGPGQTIYVLHLVNGQPVVGSDGKYELDQVSWAPPQDVLTLYNDNLNAPDPNTPTVGYRIGGPGQFDINAGSISLGDSAGILSCDVSDPPGGFDRYGNLASITLSGATVNVTVSGNLDMLTSTIAALGSGDVNVTSTGGSMDLGLPGTPNTERPVGYGVFTAGGGNVNVTALANIDIDGSRIATFNGGNVTVESLQGTVDVGSGGDTLTSVYYSYTDPVTGLPRSYSEDVYGSGILAYTLVPGTAKEGYPAANANLAASLPGNISVLTPQGDIIASLGGITQQALDGTVSAGPVINLVAGTPATGTLGQPGYSPGYAGNIDLGHSGVIGGTVNAKATGKISGLIIGQNVNITSQTIGNLTVFSPGVVKISSQDPSDGPGITIVGLGGVDANGLGSQALIPTFNTSASATTASQSAANQSDNQVKEQLAENDVGGGDDKNKKKTKPVLQRIKRVTVILPEKT
jgi:filamentous hemagglutinin family protein